MRWSSERLDLVVTSANSPCCSHWHAIACMHRHWQATKRPNSCSGKCVCTWVICAEALICVWKVCNFKRYSQTPLQMRYFCRMKTLWEIFVCIIAQSKAWNHIRHWGNTRTCRAKSEKYSNNMPLPTPWKWILDLPIECHIIAWQSPLQCKCNGACDITWFIIMNQHILLSIDKYARWNNVFLLLKKKNHL